MLELFLQCCIFLFFILFQCDPGVATDVLLDLIYRKSQVVMVMGGACSEVTETLAELAPYWNLIMVSVYCKPNKKAEKNLILYRLVQDAKIHCVKGSITNM